MDKHEDKAAIPGTSGDPAGGARMPPASPAQAGDPTAESKSELASIVSPSIAPTTVEMTAAANPDLSGVDAPEIAPASAAEEFNAAKPEAPDDAAHGPREIVPHAALAHARATWKFSRFTMLAASIVLAAAFGATAGVLGANGVARIVGGDAAPAELPAALQTTISQLRSEIADLKAGVDASGRNTSAQYSKLSERFDRIERVQSVANKSDALLPKETTGSVTLPSAAAAPLPPLPVPQSGIVTGWAVRDVYRGVAMLQSRVGSMVEVETGDVLPGLGRIEAIRRQDGRWVVITSKGMITSMR